MAAKVESFAVSADKTKLALAYDDHIIRLHDLSSGKLLQNLEAHKDSIQTVNFNNDGSKLISGDWADQAIIWNTASGKIVKKKNMGGTVMHASYSTDDRYLIVAIDEEPLAFYDKNLKRRKSAYSITRRYLKSQKTLLMTKFILARMRLSWLLEIFPNFMFGI